MDVMNGIEPFTNGRRRGSAQKNASGLRRAFPLKSTFVRHY